jgi:hypothetical protein
VIEGWRLLPWFQEAARRDPTIGTRTNCEKCMRANNQIVRQGMGCGFEPAPPTSVPVMPWQPPMGSKGYQGDRPKICAGYTTSLPEVVEASLAHAHWRHGQLAVFCGGAPTEDLMQAVLILEGAYNAVDLWRVTPANEGGGAR